MGGPGEVSLTPRSLVRGDSEAIERLDRMIAAARLQVSVSEEPLSTGRLASLLDLRGHHTEALEVLRGGATEAPYRRSPEAPQGWVAATTLLEAIASRHANFAAERDRRLGKAESPQRSAGAVPRPVKVLDASEASVADVAAGFIGPGIPCVLRNAGVAPEWSPETLVERLGSRRVPLRRCVPSSTGWAQLEFAGTAPFDAFVSEHVLTQGGASASKSADPDEGGAPQLFDFSVWQQNADVLADDVVMPKWFPVDLYSHATGYVHPVTGSAAPTLFLAAKGTGSALHVDFMQTHFWMALCQGSKHWRLLPREDLAMLYPMYLTDLNPCFPVELDALADASEREVRPALQAAELWEVTLQPGDVIFVPGGWPHQVSNLELSLAISANFIDRTNVAGACHDADLLGQVSEDPQLVAAALRSAQTSGLLDRIEATAPAGHCPLREFKARHGEPRAPYETQRRVKLVGQALVLVGLSFCGLSAWLLSARRARTTAA